LAMAHDKRSRGLIAALAIVSLVVSASRAESAGQHYVQHNLVANTSSLYSATTTDPFLLNPWGIAFLPGGPFWIADNNKGFSTLYDGMGNIVPLQVEIPIPTGGTPPSTPTGIVVNANPTLFIIPTTADPAIFIFAAEDGTISAWNPGFNPTLAKLIVDNADLANGPVYKGLAMGTNSAGTFLYATNFRSGHVDVFDSTFAKATLSGDFTDPKLPMGYAPFGIASINGDLFVTYAKQDPAKHDPVHGKGLGLVDIFDSDGHLIRRFASHGFLNAPWGVVQATFSFGQFSNDILVGNFGNGKINVFRPKTGEFLDHLRNPENKPIAIDGLWTLTFGGALHSSPDVLYFSAGPKNEMDGIFGSITPR
jgi:uncharacterized protein (TIGR03118 family)